MARLAETTFGGMLGDSAWRWGDSLSRPAADGLISISRGETYVLVIGMAAILQPQNANDGACASNQQPVPSWPEPSLNLIKEAT